MSNEENPDLPDPGQTGIDTFRVLGHERFGKHIKFRRIGLAKCKVTGKRQPPGAASAVSGFCTANRLTLR